MRAGLSYQAFLLRAAIGITGSITGSLFIMIAKWRVSSERPARILKFEISECF